MCGRFTYRLTWEEDFLKFSSHTAIVRRDLREMHLVPDRAQAVLGLETIDKMASPAGKQKAYRYD
jgi:hypothetical protein